jgi:putative Holliday junction resolvase
MTRTTRANLGAERTERDAEARSSARILAVDYGRKRIGLALSDELGITAQPLVTITRMNRRELTQRLRELCAKHSVGRIIVGHPLHINGERSEMALEAEQFAAQLSKELGIATELFDERLTTWEAKQTVTARKPASGRKEPHFDAIAAAVLLRDYLDTRSQVMHRTDGQQTQREP